MSNRNISQQQKSSSLSILCVICYSALKGIVVLIETWGTMFLDMKYFSIHAQDEKQVSMTTIPTQFNERLSNQSSLIALECDA